MLALYDGAKARAAFTLSSSGRAQLFMMDQQQNVRAAMETAENGTPQLYLNDAKGKKIWEAKK